MKRILVTAFLFFFMALHAQDLKITRVRGDFYVFTTYKELDGKPFPSNGMYVVTKTGVLLFDTPWDETQFQPLLDSIWRRHHKKIEACFVTHSHADRTAGLEFLNKNGVKTYSSKRTYDLCVANKEKLPSKYFTLDTTIHLGDFEFEFFYPGEGHTSDNMVIWFPSEKILYGGCFVKSTESKDLGNIADANLKAWPKSIKKVISKFKKPNFVIPGHFGWSDKKSLEHTLKLLEQHNSK